MSMRGMAPRTSEASRLQSNSRPCCRSVLTMIASNVRIMILIDIVNSSFSFAILSIRVEVTSFFLIFPDLTDECGLGTHNCDVNSLCINNNVSFSCECLPGFNGTGTNGTCSGNIC